MKAAQCWNVGASLGEPGGRLCGGRDLPVVVVEIAGMGSDDPIGSGLDDRRLHELNQLQMWNRVHLDIGKGAQDRFAHT